MTDETLEPLVTLAPRGSTTLLKTQTPWDYKVPGRYSMVLRCKEMLVHVLQELVLTSLHWDPESMNCLVRLMPWECFLLEYPSVSLEELILFESLNNFQSCLFGTGSTGGALLISQAKVLRSQTSVESQMAIAGPTPRADILFPLSLFPLSFFEWVLKPLQMPHFSLT